MLSFLLSICVAWLRSQANFHSPNVFRIFFLSKNDVAFTRCRLSLQRYVLCTKLDACAAYLLKNLVWIAEVRILLEEVHNGVF